jgi:NADPH:quinone reductase-like Zn-dependent oxidoreductase
LLAAKRLFDPFGFGLQKVPQTSGCTAPAKLFGVLAIPLAVADNLRAADRAGRHGIGTAFLQLGQLANLTMYGIASKSKHDVLTEYGATPIDYRTQDFVEVIRKAEPDDLEAVFDGIGGDYIKRGFSLLRRGGTYVGYGNPLSLSRTLHFLGQVILLHLLPNGRSARYYGTGISRFNRRPFLEDWAPLFKLLEEGKIKPVIEKKYPILDAAQANGLLESGTVTGNLVLLTPELL